MSKTPFSIHAATPLHCPISEKELERNDLFNIYIYYIYYNIYNIYKYTIDKMSHHYRHPQLSTKSGRPFSSFSKIPNETV